MSIDRSDTTPARLKLRELEKDLHEGKPLPVPPAPPPLPVLGEDGVSDLKRLKAEHGDAQGQAIYLAQALGVAE